MLSTSPIPLIEFEWLIRGVQRTASQSRILQSSANGDYPVEFEIKNYSESPDLIRDNIDFFETDFEVEFENPADSGITA